MACLLPATGAGVTTGAETTFFRTFWIPNKAVYQFQEDGAQNNVYPYNLMMFIMAYDTFGTLVTDNIASVQAFQRISSIFVICEGVSPICAL
eukprot:765750-Hanusia_phi.AAC.1